MKYIHFENQEVRKSKKTKIIKVFSVQNDDLLGEIKWWPGWRQYTFHPAADTLFNRDCLIEIANYTDQLNSDHKLVQAVRSKEVTRITDELLSHHLRKGE